MLTVWHFERCVICLLGSARIASQPSCCLSEDTVPGSPRLYMYLHAAKAIIMRCWVYMHGRHAEVGRGLRGIQYCTFYIVTLSQVRVWQSVRRRKGKVRTAAFTTSWRSCLILCSLDGCIKMIARPETQTMLPKGDRSLSSIILPDHVPLTSVTCHPRFPRHLRRNPDGDGTLGIIIRQTKPGSSPEQLSQAQQPGARERMRRETLTEGHALLTPRFTLFVRGAATFTTVVR